MNTAEIDKLLRAEPASRKVFQGVYACDRLPKSLKKFPCGIVANTDKSTESGTHWLAYFFPEKGRGEFFDSYGHFPLYYNEQLNDFLIDNSCSYKCNTETLQSSLSSVCGEFCIYFIAHRARGYSMSKIVNTFGSDKIKNDNKVFTFVKTRMIS